MEWALGITANLGGIEIAQSNGQLKIESIGSLSNVGLPTASKEKRLPYTGDLSSWELGAADAYLEAYGISLPENVVNRQTVFLIHDKKTVIHVPAIVLMRALFKPSHTVLLTVFRPGGIDELSFVDYSVNPPKVVIDDHHLEKHISRTHSGANRDKPLQWLQLSKSARNCAYSVFKYACEGKLGFDLPKGHLQIIFHGRLIEGNLYVAKANVVAITTPAEDSLTKRQEKFYFHAMASAVRKPTASIKDLIFPKRPDGSILVNEQEWLSISPIFKANRGKQNTDEYQRNLLNTIIQKRSSGLSWKKTPCSGISIIDLKTTFRRWMTTGRINSVIEELNNLRKINPQESIYH